MEENYPKSKIKEFWLKHEQKIVLTLGFILVAVISYEAGILKGQEMKSKPLVIEKPVDSVVAGDATQKIPQNGQDLNIPMQNVSGAPSTNSTTIPQNCAFVGSKNSNKYHLPTCSFAKRIKPENLVCFSSIEDAVKKGYQPDTNCLK